MTSIVLTPKDQKSFKTWADVPAGQAVIDRYDCLIIKSAQGTTEPSRAPGIFMGNVLGANSSCGNFVISCIGVDSVRGPFRPVKVTKIELENE